jgi:hypothetical protein
MESGNAHFGLIARQRPLREGVEMTVVLV